MTINSALTGMLLACCSNTPFEQVIDPVFPQYSLSAFGGRLVGYNAGEWVGALYFVSSPTKYEDVISDNVHGVCRLGDEIFAFTGLSHLTANSGAVHLIRKEQDKVIATQLRDLGGEPGDVICGNDLVSFRASTGEWTRVGNKASPVKVCYELRSSTDLKAVACTSQRDEP